MKNRLKKSKLKAIYKEDEARSIVQVTSLVLYLCSQKVFMG